MKKNLGNIISWSSVMIVIITIYTKQPSYILFGIIIAAIMDLFDGKMARKYGEKTAASNLFGEITDSLCDIFNYAIAPSIILGYVIYSNEITLMYLILSGIFIISGNYRLARFSALKLNKTTTDFVGLPITIAGPLLAFLSILFSNIVITYVLMIVLSYLMVCNIKFKKLKI